MLSVVLLQVSKKKRNFGKKVSKKISPFQAAHPLKKFKSVFGLYMDTPPEGREVELTDIRSGGSTHSRPQTQETVFWKAVGQVDLIRGLLKHRRWIRPCS